MNPLATNHPLSWFKKFHADGALDLSPKFQRRPVWSESQSSYLIDSILNDLPIPEIFLRTKTSASGDIQVEVVDGQQRLRSMIKFFNNELALEGDDVSEAWRGTTWAKLTPEEREKFWAFKVVVRELETASDSEVRDMFRRLNANQSNLNDQELRHSQLFGHFIKCVEALADDPWWVDKRIVSPGQLRRMLDVEYVSELFVGLMSGPLDKKEGLETLFTDYDEVFPDQEDWQKKFKKTRDLTEMVTDGDLSGWRSKTEYYSLFLACGRLVLDQKTPKGQALARMKSRLKLFRRKVDKAKQKDNRVPVPQYVSDYVDAVARASTDLGRRLHRISVIESLLLGKIPPTWTSTKG